MRANAFTLSLAVAGALALSGLASPGHACSIRGNHCGYPSWAANAFEGRFGFKGNPAILTDRFEGQPPRNIYRHKSRKAQGFRR